MDAVLCFDYTTVTMSHYGLVIVTICLRIPQQSHWSTSVATVPALETCVSFYKSKMRNTRQARHMVCLPALTGTHTQGRLGWVGLGGWAAKLFTRAKMKRKKWNKHIRGVTSRERSDVQSHVQCECHYRRWNGRELNLLHFYCQSNTVTTSSC